MAETLWMQSTSAGFAFPFYVLGSSANVEAGDLEAGGLAAVACEIKENITNTVTDLGRVHTFQSFLIGHQPQ